MQDLNKLLDLLDDVVSVNQESEDIFISMKVLNPMDFTTDRRLYTINTHLKKVKRLYRVEPYDSTKALIRQKSAEN